MDNEKDVLAALASWVQAQPQQRTRMFEGMFGEQCNALHLVHSANGGHVALLQAYGVIACFSLPLMHGVLDHEYHRL